MQCIFYSHCFLPELTPLTCVDSTFNGRQKFTTIATQSLHVTYYEKGPLALICTYWQTDWRPRTAAVCDYFLSSTPPGNRQVTHQMYVLWSADLTPVHPAEPTRLWTPTGGRITGLQYRYPAVVRV